MMVALTAGAIAITSIYFLSAASSRHFQEQQRVSQNQMAVRTAVGQLRRDIARAGFLGTPNALREQRCVAPAVNVQAIEMLNGAATANLENAAANGVEADTLRLVGNYLTGDQYLSVRLDATGTSLNVQQSWQGFRRSFGYTDTTGAYNYSAQAFEDVFRPGRVLHVRNREGNHFFPVIAGVDGATTRITLQTALPVNTGCSGGLMDGAEIAPLARIEYTVVSPAGASFASLRTAGGPPGANGALLVRREVQFNAAATPIAGTERVIAEYVANFDVDLVMDDQVAPTGAPNLVVYRDGNAQNAVANNPHRARSALVSLSLRSRLEDPGFVFVARNAGDPLTRFDVATTADANTNWAARVRTLATEVFLPSVAHRRLRP